MENNASFIERKSLNLPNVSSGKTITLSPGSIFNQQRRYSFNELNSDELKEHLKFIETEISQIEQKANKNKVIEKYEESERDMNSYIFSQKNLSLTNKKFLKSLVRQKLYDSFICKNKDDRINIVNIVNKLFQGCVNRIDEKTDIKNYFGSEFSVSHLNVELNDIEYLSTILKGMENAVLSNIKSHICMRLNIDSLPNFLINNSKNLLKQKIKRMWRISYEIPVNNLKIQSRFGYKFLNEKFLDLINERFNLFDHRYISEEIRSLLLEILIVCNLEYMNMNEYNMQSFLNNTKRYIILLGLDHKFEEMAKIFTDYINDKNILLNVIDYIENKFTNLREKLKNEYNLISQEIDKEKKLIIIFSFSIMLNNLMTFNIETDQDNNLISKIVFSPELRCSSRERQFLINLLIYMDIYLLQNYDETNHSANFTALNINYMLENSIFSSLIKSYTKVLFDEEMNKTKENLEYEKIIEIFDNNCENHEEYFKMKTLLHDLIKNNSYVEPISPLKKITKTITGKFKSFYSNFLSPKNNSDEDRVNTIKKISVQFSDFKLIPYDPINISTHICICINGHLLEGDIEKIWKGFTINEKSVDYYFLHWREESKYDNFLSDAMIFLNKLKNNLSTEQAREENQKQIFRKNKALSKIFGKILAYIIATRSIFKFHVISLIGFSLGCNVIKHCIAELNKILELNYDLKEIIQNIVFIGGAAKINHDKYKYEEFFKIIAGRIVNCYSTNDKLLENVYSPNAIGLRPLTYNEENTEISNLGAPKKIMIENYDLSELKIDQDGYHSEISKILKTVNIL
jgi:hypothetical protein